MDSKLTPMMKQYMEMKKKHQEEILFFRLGDFYEMFFEDAHIASKILDIALTSRQNDVPMCGIPYHAAESYIARLIKAGRKVAICEQMETVPSAGNIVRRDVVRIITPGTLIEENLIQSDDNNFLAAVVIDRDAVGMAFIDISTGDFFISTIGKSIDLFRGEIAKYSPREIVLYDDESNEDKSFHDFLKARDIPLHRISEWLYDRDYMTGLICDTFHLATTKGLGLDDTIELMTAGAILQYLKETHKKSFDHLKYPRKRLVASKMLMDEATITNLELVRNMQDGTKSRTLFSVLNYTQTPMGKRSLEHAILEPLLDSKEIEERLDAVQYFFEYHDLLAIIQVDLDQIHDMERLISRLTLGRTYPRNFIAIMQSIDAAMRIKETLAKQPNELLAGITGTLPDLGDLADAVRRTITDNPPLSPEQGRVIREGYSEELDRLYNLKANSKQWIVEYQEKEKSSLGIPTLKIRYNRILGYYIEISRGQVKNVPEHYFRKQTLVGSERYTTEELQQFESEILSASDTIISIENGELEKLKEKVLGRSRDLQALADTIGRIDLYCSLARAAIEHNYIRPVFLDDGSIHIREGRHPVVEKYYTREVFIPNDIVLDCDENVIKIITGPNMSGKSTYIRMCAVIQLMAQIGSYVPAMEARVSVVDRIFTRIGASDNIARGESTFLVEMNETANILNNAGDKSLIIMDEIGRGTSTYDGLSIAWAIVEYIIQYVRAKTLFATHYHELTKLGSKKGIINYNVLVKEHLSGVEFLYKVSLGAADKSYGIHVAKLAGIPKAIIQKAETILQKLEKGSKTVKEADDKDTGGGAEQLEIFNAKNHIVVQAIKKIDIDALTPLEAINELHRIKKLMDV